jgi:diguanylate cyclase (GGDEF)-like protein
MSEVGRGQPSAAGPGTVVDPVWMRGLALGLLGLALHVLVPLPLLGQGAPPALLGAAPVLLAFLLLGNGPGLLAGILLVAAWLVPWSEVSLVHTLVPLEAFCVAWLTRRWGSAIFAAAVYWCGLGWLLVAGLTAAQGAPAAPALAARALGGLLNATIVEAVLLALAHLGADVASRPAEDLERYLSRRMTFACVAPAWPLAVVAARHTADQVPTLYLVLLLTFGLALLTRPAAARLARRISVPLQAADRALADTERGLSDGAFGAAFRGHPVTELRGLGAGLAAMYSALLYHDPLTGLPNRKLVIDRLSLAVAQALRTGEGVGLLYVDIDRFRAIDHSFGRVRSDGVLQQIADRLHRCVRAGDTVARVGDDEFALILARSAGMDEVVETAQRVMDSVRQAFSLDGREVFLTASVGIGLCPRDGSDAETLLKNAQAGCHGAKEGGQQGSYRRYTARISAKDARRVVIESSLRGALGRGDVALLYQPCVGLPGGRIIGMEALVRCPGPAGSLILPGEFIPVAEASDLIVELGRWVLRTACQRARALHDRGHRLAVSVNLSARQLHLPGLVAEVLGALEVSGLPPRSLELEVTEGVAIQDMERSVTTLRELRGHGVSIAMDDFGTGYSSLGYLRQMPIDVVKLDKSLVQEIQPGKDAALVPAVIGMAHSLGLRVVAEGVETEAQLRSLRQHGCDALQGFLFSPPVPADQLEALLDERRSLAPA